MQFQRAFSGAPWEEKISYCRALRAGDRIFVTGTAPVTEEGTTFAPGDAYRQARRCLEIIRESLLKLGAENVLGARMRKCRFPPIGRQILHTAGRVAALSGSREHPLIHVGGDLA